MSELLAANVLLELKRRAPRSAMEAARELGFSAIVGREFDADAGAQLIGLIRGKWVYCRYLRGPLGAFLVEFKRPQREPAIVDFSRGDYGRTWVWVRPRA